LKENKYLLLFNEELKSRTADTALLTMYTDKFSIKDNYQILFS